MKSRKMFSLALAFIMAFSLIPTQSALAADKSKIISLPSIDGSTKIEYTLSYAPSGTVEYTYNTYENYRLVGENEEFDTVSHTVTAYQVPLDTFIMVRVAGNIIPSYIYVGQNEPDNSIANLSYNETYGDFRPQYNVTFIVPDTENYYFISACDESGARKDNGFWIKAVDSDTKPEPIYDPGIKTATPSTCNVQINGQSVSFDAYVIDGNNYMKLRDVAYALNGTGKQFEVTWDEENSDISIMTKTPYTPVGGELAKANGTAQTALPYSKMILVSGKEAVPKFYTIGENNYVKLRDIAGIINFWVDWDGATNTVIINTSVGYDGTDSWDEQYGNWH